MFWNGEEVRGGLGLRRYRRCILGFLGSSLSSSLVLLQCRYSIIQLYGIL
jgi:hypothetical protein